MVGEDSFQRENTEEEQVTLEEKERKSQAQYKEVKDTASWY